MATVPSSTPDAPPSSSVSSTNNDGAVDFSYRDGLLTRGTFAIKDEDIITVTKDDGSGSIGYKIFSLAPADEGGGGETKQPFELHTTDAATLPNEFLERWLFKALPPQLQEGNDIHVLISTLSGTGLSPSFFSEVLHHLLRVLGLPDTSYNVVRTKSAESVKEFAGETLLVAANEGRKQTVVMLSGDGGMVDVINGLLETGSRSDKYTKPIFSQLPLGTGNALFHSLHKSSPLSSLYVQGLRTLLHGTPHALPVFRANFSPGSRLLTNEARTATPLTNNTLYGAVVASYGLHATLVADSDTSEYRKHGNKRFRLVAKDLLFPENGGMPHRYQADVKLRKKDGEEQIAREEHGYVLMSLVSNLEKAFTISPESKPLDGQLRVVHFGPLGGEQAMAVMAAAYDAGKHVQMEEVGYESVEGVKIEFREQGENWKWRRCCIDGLIVGVEEGGWMEVSLMEKGNEAVSIVID